MDPSQAAGASWWRVPRYEEATGIGNRFQPGGVGDRLHHMPSSRVAANVFLYFILCRRQLPCQQTIRRRSSLFVLSTAIPDILYFLAQIATPLTTACLRHATAVGAGRHRRSTVSLAAHSLFLHRISLSLIYSLCTVLSFFFPPPVQPPT